MKDFDITAKDKELGIYIHIPFCEKKCDYCNFVSFCKPSKDKAEYISALKKEIEIQGSLYKGYIVDTIFIGGGTPSTLLDGQILDILQSVKNNFNVSDNAEISIECNPNSLTDAKLKEYKQAGINRISIGLQAYNNRLLKLIGRLHNKKQFDNAIKLCKINGFDNINADLILGIPTQKLCDVKRELWHLKRLKVKHISAYGLIVEEGTKLSENLKNGVYNLPSEEIQVKMYDYTKKYLQKHGFFRYEVSNFAQKSYESKHNLKYWTNKDYLGLGLTSSSYCDGYRWKNTDNFEEYIDSVNKNILPQKEKERIDKNAQIEECIMLSLRTGSGLNCENLKKRFGFDILKSKKIQIDNLVKNNLIEIKNQSIVCTDICFKMLNQVILELID